MTAKKPGPPTSKFEVRKSSSISEHEPNSGVKKLMPQPFVKVTHSMPSASEEQKTEPKREDAYHGAKPNYELWNMKAVAASVKPELDLLVAMRIITHCKTCSPQIGTSLEDATRLGWAIGTVIQTSEAITRQNMTAIYKIVLNRANVTDEFVATIRPKAADR